MNDISLNSVSEICSQLLIDFPAASSYRSYVYDRISKESVEKFSIGYFPEHNYIDILSREVGEDNLLKLSLLIKYDLANAPVTIRKGFFGDHPLIIPYKNVCGEIIGLIGRTLLSDADRKKIDIAKYKNTSFKKGHYLYGIYEAKQAILDNDFVYIVEGQFDVIKAHEVGLKNIVAIGNAGLSVYQFATICRYTKNIRLLLDNDVAGDKGRILVKNKFGKLANILDFYVQAPFKDLDECIRETKSFPTFKIKK